MKMTISRGRLTLWLTVCVVAIVTASVFAGRERILHNYGERYPFLTKILGECTGDAHGHDHSGCTHDHNAATPLPASACGHNHGPGETCASGQPRKATSAHEHDHGAEMVFTHQAMRNIGITKDTLRRIKIGNLPLTINYPAMVAERPGRSTTNVTAPVSGIVLRIYRQPGEMLFPGEPLMDMDLSNESVVAQQMELLSLCQKLDIVQQELKRLGEVAEGLVTKNIREAEFEKRQLESDIQAMVKTLALSGFSEINIRNILLGQRKLIRRVTIPVPVIDEDRLCSMNTLLVRDEDAEVPPAEASARVTHTEACDAKNQDHLQLMQLFIEKGQRVSMGDQLCKISDMNHLYICGQAWDYDEAVLMDSLAANAPVAASFQNPTGLQTTTNKNTNIVRGLRIKYVDNQIDADTRTLNFYVELKNELLGCACASRSCPAPGAKTTSTPTSATTNEASGAETAAKADDNRALHWRYRPGQRCELQIQHDSIPNCVLLPSEAVAASGIEYYVFRLVHMHDNAYSLLPVSVNVIRQTRDVVAVANDGSLPKDAVIATRGASQLVVAMNSARGGGSVPESACPCDNH